MLKLFLFKVIIEVLKVCKIFTLIEKNAGPEVIIQVLEVIMQVPEVKMQVRKQ